MIALFDEPIRASLAAELNLGPVGLVVGIYVGALPSAPLEGVVCLADGSLIRLPAASFALDWRYSAETDQWTDLNSPQADQDGVLD